MLVAISLCKCISLKKNRTPPRRLLFWMSFVGFPTTNTQSYHASIFQSSAGLDPLVVRSEMNRHVQPAVIRPNKLRCMQANLPTPLWRLTWRVLNERHLAGFQVGRVSAGEKNKSLSGSKGVALFLLSFFSAMAAGCGSAHRFRLPGPDYVRSVSQAKMIE